jgi:hypothetical protein
LGLILWIFFFPLLLVFVIWFLIFFFVVVNYDVFSMGYFLEGATICTPRGLVVTSSVFISYLEEVDLRLEITLIKKKMIFFVLSSQSKN